MGAVSSFVDGANLQLAQAPVRLALEVRGAGDSEASGDTSYIDFLLPGLAVWGVMSFSIIGLATTIAVYREKRILIRIQSTPLKVRVFVVAQVLASLLLSIVQAAIILAVGMAIFSVSIPLSQAPQLCVLILMGNLVFLNLGFIVGAFSKTVAAASGLGNAVSLPLMFLSGVFFPTDSPAGGIVVRDRVSAAGSAIGDVQERRAGFRRVLGLPHAVRHSGRVDSAEQRSRHADFSV